MEEVIVEIAKLIRPQELIYFVLIVGLFIVICFQEVSFRKKDRQQSHDLLALVKVINELSTQVNSIAEIIRFLATAKSRGSGND